MAKRIALYDFVEVDNVTISNFTRRVNPSSEHNRVDVSGFSASGKDEFLLGNTTQEITLEVYGSYGTNEIFQVLYPLHRDKTVFYFRWRPNVNSSVSATNPELRGNAILPNWSPEASRGDVETFTITLVAGDANGFTYYYT